MSIYPLITTKQAKPFEHKNAQKHGFCLFMSKTVKYGISGSIFLKMARFFGRVL